MTIVKFEILKNFNRRVEEILSTQKGIPTCDAKARRIAASLTSGLQKAARKPADKSLMLSL